MRLFFSILIFPLLLLADPSDLLYDDSEVAVIRIQVAPDDLIWMYDNVQSDSLHAATVHFKNAFIDETIEQVGFRIRGNTSRVSAKKSFKLSFNTFIPGREFYGVDKMNLNGEHNDPSIIRSKLCWDIFQDVGMAASRAAHCVVYINDAYYGLYISIEHIDDEFLNKNFENDEGNLWKCLWPADLNYRGSGKPEDYHPYHDETRPYELKTNEDGYDYSKLAHFIDVINNTSISEFPEAIEQVLHVPDFLSYIAVNLLTGGWDDYWFLRNNYYLYHDPGMDKFRWIPYDYDNTFSIDWFGVDWAQVDPYTFRVHDNDGRPLVENILAVPQYRNLYTHMLEFYREHVTQLSQREERIDSLKSMITPWVEIDTFRTKDYGFSMTDFHQSYIATGFQNQHVKRGIKEFINVRSSTLPSQLHYQSAAPLIYSFESWPEKPAPEDSIYVMVSAFSHLGLKDVTIAFHPGDLTVVESYPMSHSPIPASNKIEEADRWIGVIPPLGELGTGRIQVVATDISDQQMVYPRGDAIPVSSLRPSGLPLVINEFMAKNESGPVDPAGEHDDWVEIYNSGDSELNLTGMYLSDKPDNLTKWQFPETGTTIGSGEFLLVWCDEDGDQDQEGLHANFKLSANGEDIILTEGDGISIVDHIIFGPQMADHSYGRYPDGSDDWTVFAEPTPGTSNLTTSLSTQARVPETMSLVAFPNPFNAGTTISFELPEAGEITLRLFNLRGSEVRVLESAYREAGVNRLSFNALDARGAPLSSGVYVLHLKMGEWSSSHKLTLIR